MELTIQTIQNIVSSVTRIPLDMMLKKNRKREYCQARQVSMYFCRKYTKASLSTIGRGHNNKDHATVLHAEKHINNLLDIKDAEIMDIIQRTENRLRGLQKLTYPEKKYVQMKRAINSRQYLPISTAILSVNY